MELGQIQSRAQDGTRGGLTRGMEETGKLDGTGSKLNGTGNLRLVDQCLKAEDGEEDDEEEEEDEDEDLEEEVEDEEEEEEEDEDDDMIMMSDTQLEEDMTTTSKYQGNRRNLNGIGGEEEEEEIRVVGGGYCDSYGRVTNASTLASGEPTKRLKLAARFNGRISKATAAGKLNAFSGFGGGLKRASPSFQIDDHHQHHLNNRSASAASYGSSSQASTLSPSVVVPGYLQFVSGICEQEEYVEAVTSKSDTHNHQQERCKLASMSPQEQQQQQQHTLELQSASSPNISKYQSIWQQQQQQQQQTAGGLTDSDAPLQHHRQTTPDNLLQNRHLNHMQQQQQQQQQQLLYGQKSSGARAQHRFQSEERQQQLNQHHQITQLHSSGEGIHNGHSQTNGRIEHNNFNRCDSDNSAFNVTAEQRENGAFGGEVRGRVGFIEEDEDDERPAITAVQMLAAAAVASASTSVSSVVAGSRSEHEIMIGQRSISSISPGLQQQAAASSSRLSADSAALSGQQQELAAFAAKLKTPNSRTTTTIAAAAAVASFMNNQVSSVSSTTSTSSSSSINSSNSVSSATQSTNLSTNNYLSSSMFAGRQQQQHQRIPTASNNLSSAQNIISSRNDNQSIETENHKLLEQQQHLLQNHQQQQQQPLQRHYPPNHPLGNTKHLCSICGDRATGKHYGVYSCEGCKGFFKRTIRKDIVYVCRSDGDCLIDMRQRNRCQYCRYQKCLRQGMKREAVQEEKQRLKLRACAIASGGSAGSMSNCDNQVESTSNLMIGHHTFTNNNNNNNNNTNSNNNINSNCSQNTNSNNNLSSSSSNNHQSYGGGSSSSNDYISAQQQQQQHKQQQATNATNQIHLSEIVEAQLNVCDRINQHNSTSSNHHHHQQHYDLQQQINHHHNHLQNNTTNNNNNNHQTDISPSPTSITLASNNPHYLNSHYSHHYHHHQALNSTTSNRLPVMRDYNSYYNATINESNLDPYHHHQPPRKYSRIDDLTLKWAAQLQIEQLLDWAKSVPNFTELLIDDQITLLKAYWNELIISDIAFKSIDALKENQANVDTSDQRSLCIGRGLFINEHQAYEIGLSNMFDRIIDELVVKMHDMRIDSNELACLRAIILFNPETQGLKTSQPIEEYRGNVYTALEMYCRKTYDNQPNRFGKLLLRLPALRSIGLKCDSMRRCDSNNNNLKLINESSSAVNSQQGATGGSSPSGGSSTTTMLGYQVKLLFFDICYDASAIDSFLRSNLMQR